MLALAEQWEYEPNQLAHQLLNRRSNTIGVIVPKISYPLYSQAITGIETVVEREGYQLLICQSGAVYEKEVRQVQSLLSFRVAGQSADWSETAGRVLPGPAGS
ncbi:hypothetical protein GCM10023187_12150 [Nibrella viscosa]|uniref:LacI family transcriptional regulator n=1 Tax=Nibrella viscosa TaxID=1084524 RepID=A0ABP8K2Q3_9BACT